MTRPCGLTLLISPAGWHPLLPRRRLPQLPPPRRRRKPLMQPRARCEAHVRAGPAALRWV